VALRNCWRQVWNDGDVRGGACTRGAGMNELGEPQMSLEGNSDGYWLRAQGTYDIEVAQRDLGPELKKIKPWSGGAA
jgi:hypothetical protein